MGKKRKKHPKPKPISWEEIERLLRKGAKRAEELDKTLKRIFRLTPKQLRQPLD